MKEHETTRMVELPMNEFVAIKKKLKTCGIGIVSSGNFGNVEIGCDGIGTGLYMFDTGYWSPRVRYYSEEDIKRARLDATGDLVIDGAPFGSSGDDWLRIPVGEDITVVFDYLVGVNAALSKRYKEELHRLRMKDMEET